MNTEYDDYDWDSDDQWNSDDVWNPDDQRRPGESWDSGGYTDAVEEDGRHDDYAGRRSREKQRRRRNSRRVKHRRKAAGIAAAAVCAAVLIAVLSAAGVLNLRKPGRKSSVSSGQSGDSPTSVSSVASASAAVTEENDALSTGSAADLQSSEESTTASEEETAPLYVFRETPSTIDLGQSLTDISIYDWQRHIDNGSSDSGESGTDGSTEGSTSPDSSSSEETAGSSGSSDSSSSDSEDDPAMAPDYVDSQYAILVNADTGEIVAQREGRTRIVPASMTKVMTLLVAVEQMDNPDEQLQDTFEITQENCDNAYTSGSSIVGYSPGDMAKVEDLLYGAILPSGADAAMALAEYTAGSEDRFSDLMNRKAEELGIADTTHFTNCIGLYNEDHYSTPYDMAVIMRAAYENDLCRKVLSTHTWTTQGTQENPDGITISNWFLRKIEDHIKTGTVECGKTGFVDESGNCAVSTFTNADSGTHYIACTALTYNTWRCIFDHVNLYDTYAK